MNGHNRRRKYRRSVYRRRNIGTVLISVALSVIAFIIFLLIVGNILHKKSISRHAGDVIGEESPPVSDIIQTSQKRPSSQLSGRLCLLRTNDSSVFSERLDALLGEECKHVSVPLNNPSDGSLLYLSEVGTSIGIATSSDGDLDGAVKSAKERGMTVSGIYYLHSLSIENPLVRSAELSRAAAVIAEILGKGVDEVSVVATDMTADHIGELIEFVSDIHSLTERGAIGITVSEDILTSENASALMSNLNSSIDFLCFDLSQYGESAPAEYIDSKINSDYLIFLHMYKMRLLLPYSDSADAQNEIIGAVSDNGIGNWQIIR
ncbi:MAG: hypothetical protein E7607_03040 [Ruminococcaceae bacterium]|nr:hypothetical protein [Oscillospiraceae bacterium]